MKADNKWHYIENGDYPQIIDGYENDNYPQIPCLVEDIGFFDILYWNVKANCWDDSEADDFFCAKDEPIRWRYINSLLDEK